MATDRLAGPKLKVERANKQIGEVAALIRAFNEGEGTYETFTEHDSVNRRHVFKARCTKELPPIINVVVGECLFNLRSALDQIVYAACVRGDIEIIDRPGFPIERTEERFESALHNGKIKDRLPEVAATLRGLKPYETGNPLLYRLHMLNSLDKHRKIVPAGSAHFGQSFQMHLHVPPEATEGLKFHFPNAAQALHKEPAFLFGWDYGMKAHGNIQFAVSVAFSDIEGGQLEPVDSTLQQFSDLVAGIIRIFEGRFFKN